MFRTVGVLLFAAALACPSGSRAAESAPPPSARALDCAARYNKAMRIEETMAAKMRSLMPIMMEQEENESGSRLTEEQKAGVVEAMAEAGTVWGPIILERLIPIMAATFTEGELCALAAFYESPEGQAVIDKMPAFSNASSGVISELMPMMIDDMGKRMCKRIGCDAVMKPGRTAT